MKRDKITTKTTQLTHTRRFNKLRGMTLKLNISNIIRNPGQRRNKSVKQFADHVTEKER